MGEIIKLNPRIIIPTELDIREASCKKILETYIADKHLRNNPPTVRNDEGRYLTLDGHNRLFIVNYFAVILNTKHVYVYSIDKYGDDLTQEMVPYMNGKAVLATNINIDNRYSRCKDDAERLAGMGITSFVQLISWYEKQPDHQMPRLAS